MKKDLKDRINKVKLLILDVDGVLTKGDIIVDHQGKELKVFDVLDGFGLVLFHRAGFKTAIISARGTTAVRARAKDLGIDRVYLDAHPKTAAFKKLLKSLKLKAEQACFVGDDLTDLAVLKQVGFAVTVKNGVVEVKKIVHYITQRHGGKGAVREVIELILKTQGKWNKIVKEFSS